MVKGQGKERARSWSVRRGAALGALFLVLIFGVGVRAQPARTFVLGQGGLDWRGGGGGIEPEFLIGNPARAKVDTGNAPGDAIDYDARPGWISPLLFDEEVNIAARVLLEDGLISSPNSLLRPRTVVNEQLRGTVNGDHLAAYERKPTPFIPDANANGIVIFLDFGTPVGVQRVRFYPRNTVVETPSRPFEGDFLRGFELLVNPEETSALKAPDILVERRPRNEDPVVDIEVTPQYARIVKLRSLVETPFEIDEIEIYATGYLQSARYQTDLIDLGDRATVGRVRWVSDMVGRPQFSKMAARVRTGNDPTPVLYQRLFEGAFDNPDLIVEVSGEEYWSLNRLEQVPLVGDAENWSTWRSAENGELVTAPGPRRYIQFQFDFQGDLFDSRRLGRLEFDYLQPPIADTLVAEVFPRLAEAEKPASFRYAARLRANGPIRGFDRLEVDTNIAVDQVRDLKINGVSVAFEVEEVRRDGFTVSFPLVRNDGDLLEFTFDLPIFRFGSTFSGRAINSRFPQVPQILGGGNAVSFGPGDIDELSGLAVAIPRKQVGKLVGEIVFSGRVLTPNGDGANDELEIFFNLLQLTRPTPVALDLFDLSGRRVHTAFSEERGIGPALFRWDGRGADGELLPPGNYIWVLRVRADAFEERHSGVIAVAY